MDPGPVMVQDRINSVNLISATPLVRVPVQRVGFALSRSPDWLARIFGQQALEIQFKTFNFLHTARWVSLGRFPRAVRGQPRERLLGPRWVVFVANFDGPWDPYFGTFMEAMAEGVYDIWGQSIGYPGFPAPRTANGLREWLATRKQENQHYYAAYPWATTNDVRSAVRVRREVCSLAVELKANNVHGSVDVSLVFDDLVRRLRDCLGPIDPSPPWPAPPHLPDILPDGQIYGYVGAFPVLPQHEDQLEQAIAALPRGSSSPFRRVPGAHFARLALLRWDKVGRHPNQTIMLRNSYLLFAADFDATPPLDSASDRFARSVYQLMPAEVSSVWRHCWGFADVTADREFAALAARCRIPVLREFMDYADQSLGSVLAALAGHGPFLQLVERRARRIPVLAADVLALC